MTGEPQGTFWQRGFSMLTYGAVIDVEGELVEGSARKLREDLALFPGPTLVRLNSFGGIAFEGAAMAEVVEDHGQVTILGVGIVASAATLPFIAAKRAILHSATAFMVHDPSCYALGTAADLRQTADGLDSVASIYASRYARRAGVSEKVARSWMLAETWLRPQEVVALRLADGVQDSPDAPQPARADYSKFRNPPQALVQMAVSNGWAAAPSDGKGSQS